VGVADDAVVDTPNKGSPYSATPTAAHYYKTRPYLLAQINDLLVFSPSPKMGLLHAPPSLLDLP
jgi:hypothetical protein